MTIPRPPRSRSRPSSTAVAVLAAVVTVLVSQWARLVLEELPRPLSAFGLIDLAEVLRQSGVLSSHWPYWTFPFPYQPVIGVITALLSYVAPNLVLLILAWGLVVAAAAGAEAFLLVRAAGPRRTLVFWSLAPQLLLFGGQNFDALAVLTLMAGVAAYERSRHTLAGLVVGLGVATKLFPGVAVLPLAASSWRGGRRRATAALVTAAALVVVALEIPAIAAPHSLLRSGTSPYDPARWDVDSIWYPVSLALSSLVDAANVDRIEIVASLAGLILSYVLLVLIPALRGDDPVRRSWIAVCLVLLWSRLYSPQYSIWLLPIFALYVPRLAPFAMLTVGDGLTFFSLFLLRGQGLSPDDPAALPLVGTMLAGVIIRHAAVLVLLVLTLGARQVPDSRLAAERQAA